MKATKFLGVIGLLAVLLLNSCEKEDTSKGTFWFYKMNKIGVPTIYIDGKMVGKVNFHISSAGQISCDNTLGLRYPTKPGSYLVEVYNDHMQKVKSGNVTITGGKCHPILVDY